MAETKDPDSARTESTPHVVLAVDDNASNNALVVGTFEDVPGVRVITAESGAEALRRLEDQQVDLVLLDVSMAGMSGLDVCRTLKAHSEWKDIPVILVTAHSEPAAKLAGFEAGAEDYITKPFHPRELVARVNVHLRNRELKNELVEAARLRTLVSTVSSVHHEINNPLTTILGNAEILARHFEGEERAAGELRRIERIISSVQRIQEVIQKLREAKQVFETEYVRSQKMIDLSKL